MADGAAPLIAGAPASADLDDSFGHLLRRAARTLGQALERRTLPHGISAAHWRFVRVLGREDGLTQSALSARVGTAEPTTMKAVRSLAAAGFVTREADPADRRAVRVCLTPAGRALVPVLLEVAAAADARAIAGLTRAERAILLLALRKVTENLR